jgi:hypothetical protein
MSPAGLQGGHAMSRTVAIIQPNFAPWLGYFSQMRRADVFVYFDDVQFSRKSRAQRVAVRGPDYQPRWLSIPVVHGAGVQLIKDTVVSRRGADARWVTDHPNKLREWYRGAPYVGLVDEFAEIIAQGFETLADLNIAIIEWLAGKFAITTPTRRCSMLDVAQDLDTTMRPLAVCAAVGADRFLCGPTAKRYIDEPVFTKHRVAIEWDDFAERHPTYRQHREPFMPFLSALDYLLEHGPGWFEEAV